MEKQKQKNLSYKSSRKICLPAPSSLFVTMGDLNGEIDLTWEPVKGATNYIIQVSTITTRHPAWKHIDVVTKSSHTVTNLKHGRKYKFRVAAVSSKGQGTWSSAVNKKVI